jgi:hypothetical protein
MLLETLFQSNRKKDIFSSYFNMLTNFDLEDLSHHYKVPLVGIFMKDELPTKPQNGDYIINLQSSSQGDGTHWTGLIVEGNNALFVDPFGVEPSQEIIDFVRRKKNCRLGYTDKQIQDIHSHNCGAFVLAFFVMMQQDKKGTLFDRGNRISDSFDNIPKNNDIRLSDVFKRVTGSTPPLIRRLWTK